MASFVGSFGSDADYASHCFRLVFIFGHYYTRASVDKDDYLKLRILFLALKGYKAPAICNLLKAKNTVYRVLKKTYFCF